MQITRFSAACATAFLALAGSSPVVAQSTWNLVSGSGCSQNAANSGNFNNSWGCTSNTASTATVSAWSIDKGTGGGAAIAGSGYANAHMSPQGGSGFGTASRTEGLSIGSPNHAVDSINPGTFDFVMVQFTSAVILQQFGIGWGAADSDMTIMRWNGVTAPTQSAGTTSTGGNAMLTDTIGASGWSLVSSFTNVCKNGSGQDVTNTNCDSVQSRVATGSSLASSYWLIAAYNNVFDPATSYTASNDGFKLNFLKTASYTCPGGGTPDVGGGCGRGTVPEPMSLALVGVGLLGAVGTRRWRSRR